jgi:hypothetical protein
LPKPTFAATLRHIRICYLCDRLKRSTRAARNLDRKFPRLAATRTQLLGKLAADPSFRLKNRPPFEKCGLGLYAEALLERDPERKRACCVDLQTMLVDFSSSIFIAEVQQALVANRKVPAVLLSPRARFFQALQYQNCSSTYMPERSVA